MTDETIYKIAIAAFLHDIGKFAERASVTERQSGNLEARFYLDEQFLLNNMDLYQPHYKNTRLLTIFEGVSPDGIWKDDNLESYRFRYPLKELSPENIFSVIIPPLEKAGGGGFEKAGFEDDRQASADYRNVFFNFVSSLERLEHTQNIPLWFEHFDSLFMIYTSHIPAATVGKVVPDVSLYDHSKTTAAIASAIYLYHKQNGTLNMGDIEKIKDYDDKKFLIVAGDFYGIQNFIFFDGGSINNV